MKQMMNTIKKPVGTRDWYDFIGLLADMIPGIQMGGREATYTLLDMCGVDETKRILDVGCGGGYTACLIAEKYGAHVDGIDISEVMISKAQQRAGRRGVADLVGFRTADAYKIPFDDQSFDVVLVESVLVPLPGDKLQAIREMMRVLRPGGLIGANESTVDSEAPPEMVETFSHHPATYGTLTPDTLRNLFERAGLLGIQIGESWNIETPSPLQGMGCGGLISFMFRVYPKIVFKLLSDSRLREASRIDNQITKGGKEYMGYALITGRKPQYSEGGQAEY